MYRWVIILTICTSIPCFGQNRLFYGGIKAGFNWAQIDGDDALGYDKWAYHAGLSSGFGIGGIKEIQIEFLYSLRGSRSTKSDTAQVRYNLHYLEIPVLFCLKDWLQEREDGNFYRLHFQGGLSTGYLFNSNSNKGLDSLFKKVDLSWILGVQYFMNRSTSIYARYTSSFTPLYSYTRRNTEIKMISYFISLGLNYRFN